MGELHPGLQRLANQFRPSPVIQIIDEAFSAKGVELWIKRDDLLHPIISGNKWRKLKYCLDHALSLGAHTLCSMGGVYSNHLHALAYTGQLLGLSTLGLIRGECPDPLNPTLHDLQAWGMQLRFISRTDYRQLRQYHHHDALPNLPNGGYWLPEGGASRLALKGVAEIIDEIDMDYDYLVVGCGTGTTLAGLIAAAPSETSVLGIAALKGAAFLAEEVKNLMPDHCPYSVNWEILLDYHHGGFAKTSAPLLALIQDMQLRHQLPLEPIYTAKTLYAIYDLLRRGFFKSGQRILMIHTGGLQGTRA